MKDDYAALLTRAWADGWTVSRIADHLGLSRSYTVKLARELGLRRPIGWKPVAFTAWGGKRKPGSWAVAPAAPAPLPVQDGGERDAIATWLATRGPTRCPVGYAAPTQACVR